ncbi:MAG: hypothetical protein FWE62_04115 [Firmicutes bacterium]|nr:hypothetical protein [Bacillota bacterium]
MNDKDDTANRLKTAAAQAESRLTAARANEIDRYLFELIRAREEYVDFLNVSASSEAGTAHP